jgi:RNA polymerase sigma-70 factor
MVQRTELSDPIASLWRAAVEKHGDLGLSCAAFEARIQTTVSRYLGDHEHPGDAVRALSILNTSDLYLAMSCAHGSDAAWRRLRLLYGKYLVDLFRWMDRPHKAQEEAENLIADLFLPDQSGQSRIASYDGRSSLVTWLRVIVSHRVINERQRKGRGGQSTADLPELPDRSTIAEMEDRLESNRYLPAVRHCLAQACRHLSDHERLILLWRFDEERQLGEIARLTSIHQSTVTRQIERTLKRMRAELETLLASEFKLSRPVIQECLSLLVRHNAEALAVLRLIREPEQANCPAPLLPGQETKSRALQRTA